MKTRTIATAAVLLAAGALLGAAASQPTHAQQGAPLAYDPGEWQAAGSYHTEAGGEVWMINTRTGVARNCFWQRRHETAPLRMECRHNE